MMLHFEELCDAVAQWHVDRNLIDGSTDRKQLEKLAEELLELSVACATRDPLEIMDGIGDIMVVLANVAERNDTSLYECLEYAYANIKERKGKVINGKFVKEADL